MGNKIEMKLKIIIITMLLSTATIMLNAQISHRGFARASLGALPNENGEYSVLQNTFDWRLDYGKGDVGLYVIKSPIKSILQDRIMSIFC